MGEGLELRLGAGRAVREPVLKRDDGGLNKCGSRRDGKYTN